MTIRLSQAVAGALAAGAASFAFAQGEPATQPDQDAVSTPPSSITYANPPKSNKVPSDLAKLHFAQEPVARSLKADDEDSLVSGIVTELNKDGSLQGSKITVSVEDGVVTMTGATMTPDQKARVEQIAAAQAGEGKVIDNVLDSVT
jgi:hypothetical protein